ncbi:MAG: Ig-like domain-containing protein [Patescibacteria group bacterium]
MRNKTLLSALGAVMIVGLSLGLVPAALAATPVLTAINLTPAVVAVGATHQFTASPLDQFGNPIAATLTWTSSNTTVGTVNGSGLFSALAAGPATVTATSGSVSGTAGVSVTSMPAGNNGHEEENENEGNENERDHNNQGEESHENEMEHHNWRDWGEDGNGMNHQNPNVSSESPHQDD